MNIALIGTGAMARRFLQAVRGQVRDVHFVAAHSRNPERLEQFRNERRGRASTFSVRSRWP